jgi:hypothetical protein
MCFTGEFGATAWPVMTNIGPSPPVLKLCHASALQGARQIVLDVNNLALSLLGILARLADAMPTKGLYFDLGFPR